MNADRPLLVVSLPDRSVDALRTRLAGLRGSGADLAEVRVDRLPISEKPRLRDLFPSPLPLVATYRSRREGGEGEDAGATRTTMLDALAALPFAYVDLEREQDAERWERLPPNPARRGVIVSAHLPEGAPLEQVRAAFTPITGSTETIVKVVLPASVRRLYAELTGTLNGSPSLPGARTLLTTGPSGPILRLRAPHYGLALVYAAPPLEVAIGASPPSVEAAQPPVDALASLYAAGSRARLFALLGHPVAHSISPRMHTRWYLAERRPAIFVALDIQTAAELGDVLGPLHEDGFVGFNVTHPWKEPALTLANSASDDARRAGCANTLTYENGGWAADNFDVAALVRRIEELRRVGAARGDEMLVLGSGGAARAALTAAGRLGMRARILARRADAADHLAREFGAELETTPDRRAPVVVHATPAGRSGAPPLQLDWEAHVGPETVFLDYVYAAEDPTLAERVRARRARYEDGGRLLVYQALEVHRRWWGSYPAPPLIDRALAEVGCTA